MKSSKPFLMFLLLLTLPALATSQDLTKELEQDLSAKRPATASDNKFDVPTNTAWTDTKVDLTAGDTLTITATSEKNCDPQGASGAKASGLPLASVAP